MTGRPTNLGFNSRDVAHWSDGDDARIFLATGEIVHAVDLPATLTGTPMTYIADGKQYIVAAFGSGAGARLIALALP